MKTQFSRRTRALRPGAVIAVAALIMLAFILLVLRLFAPSTLSAVASPLFSLGASLSSTVSLPGDDARLATLARENDMLKSENALLRAGIEPAQGTRARVLARPPLTPYDVLLLDAGTDNGVYDGMRVYAGGIPIGSIESAGRTSAKAALFSAAGNVTEAWAGETRIPLTLVGAGAGGFRADVPREAGIVEGDVIYIASVPAGTVLKVETHASAPRASLSIRPFANLFSLTEVDVLASPAP